MPQLKLALFALVLLLGCRHSDRPALAPVHGQVTLNGKPLADAVIIFTPQAGGRASRGVTDAEGRYELIYLRDMRGAILGAHVVSITTAQENQPETLLPPRYHAASELRAEVGPGSNAIDFPLAAP